MTGASIVSLALAQTYKNESQLTQDIDVYLNLGYHDVENAITEYVGDNFFYEYKIADLVAGQNEYTFPVASASADGIKKVLGVEVKRSDTDSYHRMTQGSNLATNQTLEELSANTSKSNGLYEIQDSSIFLYPTPAEAVTNGLKAQVILTLKDISDTSTEAEIFPWHSELRTRHHVIALAMKPYIFGEFGMYNEKAIAQQEAEKEILKMVRSISPRYKGVVIWQLPNLSFYK